jgi:hypothetical protein
LSAAIVASVDSIATCVSDAIWSRRSNSAFAAAIRAW